MRSTAELTTRIVPQRFASRTLGEYRPETASQTRAVAAAYRMAEGEMRNLILVGPPGVGKTHLAAGIVNAIRRGKSADYDRRKAEAEALPIDQYRHPRIPDDPMWVNVADLIVELREDMHRPMDDREAASAVRTLRRWSELVVLDDLGREKVSDWTAETVYALVNARYEHELPTIVTSNLAPEELAASPYWPAVSRLAEDGLLVKVDGPDHRLRVGDSA